MSQLWLPTELWIKISTDNPLGLGERRSLVLVNKHFYEIFTPLLYSDLTFRLYISKFAKMAASHTSACYLTHLNDRLGTSDKFRSYVRNCRFILLNDCRVTEKSKLGSAFMYPLLEGIFEALANCPNLITVYLHGMKVSSHWIYRLAFSAQSIQLERCDILDAQPLPGPFTLKSLNIESSVLSALKDLVFSPSIEELQLSEFPSSLPHSRLIQGSLFGSLRRLHLEGFHDTDINALRYSHNLVDFTFDYVYRNETYSPEWKQLLPKLEKVTAYEQLIPLLITGRNITSIKVIYMSDYANLERWFGSNVAIRHIEAGAGIDVSDLVAYLAASNPEVETLSLLPLISMENLESCIKQLKQMKNLRSFSAIYQFVRRGVPREDELLWERLQCDALLKAGCSDLRTVSFTRDLIWTHDHALGIWKYAYVDDEDISIL